MWASVAVGVALGAAPAPTAPTAATADDDAALVARGHTLVQRFECNRCHTGHGLDPVAADKACVGCHAAIEADTFDAPKEVVARWREHIVDLTVAPSLTGGERFRKDWLEGFLLRPHAHDLRPTLSAQMPRLDLTPDDARALAAWIAGPEPSAPPDGLWLAGTRSGRRLAESKGCGTCHRMTGLPGGLTPSAIPATLAPDALEKAMLLAPDLRWTRERMRPQALVAWLMKPSAMKPESAMPDLPLTRLEAEDLAAFLLEAPLDPPPAAPLAERLPVLTRRVEFQEVKDRVFRKTCWHCHSEPDLALGDGGPGNTGGFGFKGRGLSFVDYSTITSGSVGDDGQRRSIFRPIVPAPTTVVDGRRVVTDDTPRLLAHILARQVEATGRDIPGVRGMPLGLPPLSPEDVQLVESWIAQGRPE
ncbi:MAG: c-type cytochrome [Myxococcota bacterium]